jgi:hypothetical protein
MSASLWQWKRRQHSMATSTSMPVPSKAVPIKHPSRLSHTIRIGHRAAVHVGAMQQ